MRSRSLPHLHISPQGYPEVESSKTMAVAVWKELLLVCGATVSLTPCSRQRLDKVQELQRKGRQLDWALKKYLTKLHAVPSLWVVGLQLLPTIRANPSLWSNAQVKRNVCKLQRVRKVHFGDTLGSNWTQVALMLTWSMFNAACGKRMLSTQQHE